MSIKPPDNENPEQRFFRNFCDGKKEALNKIYDKGYSVIRRMVRKNGGNEEDSEDIFQEGLIVLYGYCVRPHFILNTRLVGFLYSICRRLWLKKLENKGRSGITFYDIEEYVNMEAVIKLQEEELRFVENIRLLNKYLARLPEKERQVLKQYYLEGKSHREIAEAFGFANEASARVQKFRYLNHLKKLIWEDPDFN